MYFYLTFQICTLCSHGSIGSQSPYEILQAGAISRAGIILVICKSIFQPLEDARSGILQPWVVFWYVFFCSHFRKAAVTNVVSRAALSSPCDAVLSPTVWTFHFKQDSSGGHWKRQLLCLVALSESSQHSKVFRCCWRHTQWGEEWDESAQMNHSRSPRADEEALE